MTLYHGDLRKRKKSGGRKRPYRKWRRFESSGTRADTSVGEAVRASVKARGGNVKVKLLKGRHANVHDASGKT
ncbi:MAG: 30S ribosomal protein S8e, partial [Candidatus Brockarchaeota archaeon]|nr:30S ribosomal protein S8e [Candidatus Brockarchaeota archaeon]